MRPALLLSLLFIAAGAVGCGAALDRYVAADRVVEFSGYEWEIREGPSPGGAGGNYWGTDHSSIEEDPSGLTLRVTHDGLLWRAAELRTPLPRGTARVEFDVEVEGGQLGENVVLGLFVYTDDNHEADVECANWGDYDTPPWQFAHHTPHGHTSERFSLGEQRRSTHSIEWSGRNVAWTSASGDAAHHHAERRRLGSRLGVRYAHINLWLDHGRPPGPGTTDARITAVRFFDGRGRPL